MKPEIKITVSCPECAYSVHSKTVECAYTCKHHISPCKNRTVFSDFGCVYGNGMEKPNCYTANGSIYPFCKGDKENKLCNLCNLHEDLSEEKELWGE